MAKFFKGGNQIKPLTKKRSKAFAIDFILSTTVTADLEFALRKKIKNVMVHALVTPSLVMWTLEYAQLRQSGQTKL
ncbi:hypothetical protein [Virgibacillus oceani]|uniref:hypothetical protein n=1 Tax=Virgibacillus oceani TaxID=1479511 RepID=UPI00166822C6|nr:hypothetical protein [Virgibacillus oceani]